MTEDFSQITASLASIASDFHSRGWLLGTSGNLSAVVSREPLCLAMSQSGLDKGSLRPEHFMLINDEAQSVEDFAAAPSAESRLHVRLVRDRAAGAVLHTHSVWSTMLSDLYGDAGGITIEGYEMLKGLEGVKSHDHSEWLPIIENSQDMPTLAEKVGEILSDNPAPHGFLLRRHGLYSWGEDIAQAKRHVEILEFLLETVGRTLLARAGEPRAEV